MACSTRSLCIGQAPRWSLAALVLAATLPMAGSQAIPMPEQCGALVVGCIDDIVNAAYDITQAAADCTLPGLDQLSCAGDLTDMMSYWFNLGNKISTLTLVCGRLDNACAANVLQGLGDISDTSNNLVAAAQDCTTDSWLCAFDIVSAIDTLNAFIADIIVALQTCNLGDVPFVDLGAGVFPGFALSGDGGYYAQRRLMEKTDTSDDDSQKQSAAASSNEGLKSVLSELQTALPKLRERIQEQMTGAEKAGTEHERTAAWKNLVERVRSSPQPVAGQKPLGNLTQDVVERLRAAGAKVEAQMSLLSKAKGTKSTQREAIYE